MAPPTGLCRAVIAVADWVRTSSAAITDEVHALDDVADVASYALLHAPSCANFPADYAAVVLQSLALLAQADALRPGTLVHLPLHASYLCNGLWLDSKFLGAATKACVPRACSGEDPGCCVLAITIYSASGELCAHLFHIPAASYALPTILSVGRMMVSVATDARDKARGKAPATAAGVGQRHHRAERRPLQNAEPFAHERAVGRCFYGQYGCQPAAAAHVRVMKG